MIQFSFFARKNEYKTIEKDGTKLSLMFDDIEGYENEKKFLTRIITATEPIHSLIYGPPGCGKSMFGECMKKHKSLKNKLYWCTGARLSQAGLFHILNTKNLRVLFIDEIEWVKKPDQASLLTFMSSGELSQTINGKMINKKVNVIVIATCNNPDKLIPPLFDRFTKVKLEEYTEDEFREVARRRLQNMISMDMIETIIDVVYDSEGPNVRRVVDMARLQPTSREEVEEFLEVSK